MTASRITRGRSNVRQAWRDFLEVKVLYWPSAPRDREPQNLIYIVRGATVRPTGIVVLSVSATRNYGPHGSTGFGPPLNAVAIR